MDPAPAQVLARSLYQEPTTPRTTRELLELRAEEDRHRDTTFASELARNAADSIIDALCEAFGINVGVDVTPLAYTSWFFPAVKATFDVDGTEFVAIAIVRDAGVIDMKVTAATTWRRIRTASDMLAALET